MLIKDEKYKQAWDKFQNKLNSLRKRRSAILRCKSETQDQEKIEALRKKING